MEESCAAANDVSEIEASVEKDRQRCMWDILNLQNGFRSAKQPVCDSNTRSGKPWTLFTADQDIQAKQGEGGHQAGNADLQPILEGPDR